jgi:hypothetical protein
VALLLALGWAFGKRFVWLLWVICMPPPLIYHEPFL